MKPYELHKLPFRTAQVRLQQCRFCVELHTRKPAPPGGQYKGASRKLQYSASTAKLDYYDSYYYYYDY